MTRWLTVALVLCWSSTAFAWLPNYIPGDMNGWTHASAGTTEINEFTLYQYYSTTLVGGSPVMFKVTQEADWANQFSMQDECVVDSVCVLPKVGGGSSDTFLTPSDTGLYTTFNLQTMAGDNIGLAIWETVAVPVAITNVVRADGLATAVNPNDDIVINITTGAGLPIGEQHVYLRWLIVPTVGDPGQADVIVKATGSGTDWTATIEVPALGDRDGASELISGRDIEFYAFTSKLSDASAFSGFDVDLATLKMLNNGGGNYALPVFDLANCWHLPDSDEITGLDDMRVPLTPRPGDASTWLYTGNQAGGTGTIKNQTNLDLYWREQGAGAYTGPVFGTWHADQGNNKYWKAELPLAGIGAGTVVEYYLESRYSDADTTFMHDLGGFNAIAGLRATAEAAPRSFRVTGVNGSYYHRVSDPEPSGHTMREPVAPDLDVHNSITLYTGGWAGHVSAVTLHYKFQGEAWASMAHTAIVAEPMLEYYQFDLSIAGKIVNSDLRYYFEAEFLPPAGDVDTTFLYGTDITSTLTDDEAVAQAAPYSVTLAGNAIPTVSEWAMILMLLAMAVLAFRRLRRAGFQRAA
jgi:hypothetical protein